MSNEPSYTIGPRDGTISYTSGTYQRSVYTSSSNVVGADWSAVVADVSTASLRELLGLPTSGCIVCGADTSSLLCDFCVHTITEMRKKIVEGMLRELENGEVMIYHQATTSKGVRVHAVHFRAGGYAKETVCGIRWGDVKRKRFSGDGADVCDNCKRILASRA